MKKRFEGIKLKYYKQFENTAKGKERKTIIAIVIGPTGSGKTHLALNFILNDQLLYYENLYIYTRSPDQPIYKNLKKIFEGLKCKLFFESDWEEIISVDDCLENSLVIFDDGSLDKQTRVQEYFVRGRHKGISSIYIVHSISAVDPKFIRGNANYMFIFKLPPKYIKFIYDNYISNISKEEFDKICKTCWNEKFSFLTIDMINLKFFKKFTII